MRRCRPRFWIGIALAAIGLLIVGVLGLPYLVFRSMPTTLQATRPNAGHIVHVPGWNGSVSGDRDFLNALRDAGCPQAMETFDWTGGYRSLMALWRSQHNPEPARAMATRLTEIARADPTSPIDVTADSSGCGIALGAIAALPPDVFVDSVVLSSPAVSPGYDLTPVLAHVRGKIVSLNSDRDFAILAVGTTLFGTVDGHHSVAAGRVGFTCQSPQLVQINYDPAWLAAYGHSGGHARGLSPRFAEAKVAPLLR